MIPGASKDVIEHDRSPVAEPAVFRAQDLQVGNTNTDRVGQTDALVKQGLVPAVELQTENAPKLEKAQYYEPSGDTKAPVRTAELASATPQDGARVATPESKTVARAPEGPTSATPGERPPAPATTGERPATPATPAERPPAPATPGERPPNPATPGDRPATPATPGERSITPGDRVAPPTPRETSTPAPVEAPPTAPVDGQASNPQFLENAKVRRGEGPYQVASRLLAADGQPTKQADVKALTEAFKKVYGDQQKADANLPGLGGLKQNHAFINKDNLKAVTEELKKSGHPELADRLTKDATAKPADNTPKPGDAPPKTPNDAPQAQKYGAPEIASSLIGKLATIPQDQPIDKAVESLGNLLNNGLNKSDILAPGTNRDTVTEQLNQAAEKSNDPRLKGKEFHWDNNKLKLRDRAKPPQRPAPAESVEI